MGIFHVIILFKILWNSHMLLAFILLCSLLKMLYTSFIVFVEVNAEKNNTLHSTVNYSWICIIGFVYFQTDRYFAFLLIILLQNIDDLNFSSSMCVLRLSFRICLMINNSLNLAQIISRWKHCKSAIMYQFRSNTVQKLHLTFIKPPVDSCKNFAL